MGVISIFLANLSSYFITIEHTNSALYIENDMTVLT